MYFEFIKVQGLHWKTHLYYIPDVKITPVNSDGLVVFYKNLAGPFQDILRFYAKFGLYIFSSKRPTESYLAVYNPEWWPRLYLLNNQLGNFKIWRNLV